MSAAGFVWSGKAIADALGIAAPADVQCTSVSTDTRDIAPGALFVALKGERFDAHDFLAQAKERGAVAAVVRAGTPPTPGLVYFAVPDTLVALGRLARARRRALPAGAPVVAVTGSTGKTSTKEMLRAALGSRWRVHATSGNLNNLIGAPLTILSAPADTEALVVEAGASLPGEIAKLRDIIEPTIAVVTSVGWAHVQGFGSFAGVLREKLSLAEGVPLVVVGTDPPYLPGEARVRTRTIAAGRSPEADVRPDAADLDAHGHVHLRWQGGEVTIPAVGFHQVDNAMLALTVAREAGVEPRQALMALGGVSLPKGRGALLQIEGLTVIDDSYNANPASLRAALEFAAWYAAREQRPLAVVVGSMLELGSESAKLHAAAAREIAALHPTLVAAVGDFVPAFEPERSRLGSRLLTAPDAEALGPALGRTLQGDEVVLLKASRGVALERVLRYLH